MEKVILVDPNSRQIGEAEKVRAHEDGGLLHLAFCILIFDQSGRLLLQQRAAGKYHFANLWSNSCCGHPRPGEGAVAAAERRLLEEFGFTVPLRIVKEFSYKAFDRNSGLTEHEFAHILVGSFSGTPDPNPQEIGAWRWELPDTVRIDVRNSPEAYTPWFGLFIRGNPIGDWAKSAAPYRGDGCRPGLPLFEPPAA